METGPGTRTSSAYDRTSADQQRSVTDSVADRNRWHIPITPIYEQSSTRGVEEYRAGLSSPRQPPAPPITSPRAVQTEDEDTSTTDREKICGLGFWAFWVVLIFLTLLIAAGLGIGLGLGIGNARKVCDVYEPPKACHVLHIRITDNF